MDTEAATEGEIPEIGSAAEAAGTGAAAAAERLPPPVGEAPAMWLMRPAEAARLPSETRAAEEAPLAA